MLVIQLLIVTDVLKCKELLEGGNSTFFLAFFTTMLNIVTFLIQKWFEMLATGEYFVMLCLEGMTANISWLPHLHKMRITKTYGLHLNYGRL